MDGASSAEQEAAVSVVQAQKKLLYKNLHKLFENLYLGETLIAKLLGKGALTDEQLDIIQNEKINYTKIRKLIEILTKRGPEALDKLIEACEESDNEHAAKILREAKKESSGLYANDKVNEEEKLLETVEKMTEEQKEQLASHLAMNVVDLK